MLISKIRQYSWVAVGLIALCLVAFLVQDATNSNTSIFNKNKVPDFAAIYGEEVTRDAFDQRRGQALLEELTFNNQILAFEQGQYQLDNQTEFQIADKAWTSFVNEAIIDKQYEEIGLGVTSEEFSSIIYGPNPHPAIKNYYISLSQTGQYDASLLPGFIDNISNPELQQQNPGARQEYYQFICREEAARRDYKQTKYMNLFSKAAYVPEWMAKRNYTLANTRTSFTMVSLPYSMIADSTITVSDKELEAYYNKHKNKYKQTEGRAIEYVMYDFTPSAADSAATQTKLMEMVAKMKTAKKDSTFIATRSEDPDRFGNSNYSRTDLETQGVPANYIDSLFSKPAGSLIGPFQLAEYYKMVQLKSRSTMPDSVKARHILISINEQRDSSAAMKIADSIQGLLNAGGDFGKIAGEVSEDQGSATQGGDLGWSTPSVNFVPEFKDYIFKTGVVGKVGVVKTMFGIHLIEITEMKNRKEFVNIAFLSKRITPGEETIESVEKQATAFYQDHQTPELFEQGVIENRLMNRSTQQFTKSTYEIPGLSNSREVVTWAFDAELNEFKYFNLTDYVLIAYVKEIRVNGIAELEFVRNQVELEVIQEKKAEQLKQKFTDALKSGNSMDAVAAKLNLRVDTVRNASMSSPSAPLIGRDPKVIGAVFAADNGKLVGPIDGVRAVYMVQPFERTPAPETQDFTLNKNQLTYSLQNKFQGQGMLNELKTKADVIDNRYIYGD